MKRLIITWSIIILVAMLGILYHNQITNRLSRFKIVHTDNNYRGTLIDPLEAHLKEALCWKEFSGSPLPVDHLTDLHSKQHITLEDISSTNTYSIGWMEHSIPVLYPEAHAMLNAIGNDFAKELIAKNLPKHKLRITSLTRSRESQKQLTENTISSAFWYGYSFSISHQNFYKINLFRDNIEGILLQEALVHVLKKYHEEQKILVSALPDQTFFSITLRCPASLNEK